MVHPMIANHRYRQFEFWIVDEGEDASCSRGTVEATDSEFAAEEAARRYYDDGGFSGAIVVGVVCATGKVSYWEVRAEPTVYFYASEVTS